MTHIPTVRADAWRVDYLEAELKRFKDENFQKAIRLMEATRRMDLSQQYREAVEVEQQKSFEKKSAGIKYDAGKPRMELISVDFLNELSLVLSAGAKKYSDNNWRGGFNWSRLYGAALRHLTAHMNGEDTDEETGLSHLAHASCCLMFLVEHEKRGLGTDDRYKHPKKG